MKQYKALLVLRLKQGYRYLSEIGFVLIAVMLFVLTGTFFSLLQNILTSPALGSVPLSIIILVIIEMKRKDNIFLKSIFEAKQKFVKYKFIENLIVVSPILIFQLIFKRLDLVAMIIVICVLIAIISFYLVKSNEIEQKKSLKSIPLSLFEIKFYFEKNKWSLVFLWILLMLGGFHFSLWILGVLFLCMLPVEIYTPQESREMLNFEISFVGKKISKAAAFFMFYTLIPTLVTFIFSQVSILIILYGIIALLLSIILAISKKYVSYFGVSDYQPSPTSTVILILLMLAPGGILITLTACIYYYLQAENHMKKLYAII